jgi:membrane-bound serine protease (ClpP class)
VSIWLAQVAGESGDTLLWGFVLIGATIFLVALELVVPSGGILAIAAAAALIGAITAFFMHDPVTGGVALAAIAIFGPLLAWIAWKWWSDTDMARRIVLSDECDSSNEARSDLLGRQGRAETDLRPIGVVRIDDRRYDALSDHGMIGSGSTITVVKVLDNQLRVRRTGSTGGEESS